MVAVKAISPLSQAIRPQNNMVSFTRTKLPQSLNPGIQDISTARGGLPQRITGLVGAPPMPGTVPPRPNFVPIGSNIYVGRTPVVKPLDEGEFPPLSLRGGVEFFKDECNTGVSFHVEGLPSVNLLYRNPQCDFKPAKEPIPTDVDLFTPLKFPDIDLTKEYLVAINTSSSFSSADGENSKRYGRVSTLNCSPVLFNMGTIERQAGAPEFYRNQPYPYSWHGNLGPTAQNPTTVKFIDIYPPSAVNAADMAPLGTIQGLDEVTNVPVILLSGLGSLLKMFIEGNAKYNPYPARSARNPRANLMTARAIPEFRVGIGYRTRPGPGGFTNIRIPTIATLENEFERIVELKTCKKVRIGPRPILSPPPPPPPTKEDELTCCPTKPNNSDQLLKLLLLRVGDFPRNIKIQEAVTGNAAGSATGQIQEQTKRVSSVGEALSLSIERTEKVARAVGVEAFPVTAPISLVGAPEGVSGEFDFLNEEKKVGNLADFMAWQTEQMSALFGPWMQTLKFEDTDNPF